MEDEKTKVNENNSNNKNNGNESSKSSSNNDKYKSRKPSNDNNTKKSVPTRNNAFSRIKQGAKAAAFNKVANTIPGVSTLNNLNNIRKGVGGVVNRRRNTAVGSDTTEAVSDNGTDEEVTSDSTTVSNDSTEQTNEGSSFNPLRSILVLKIVLWEGLVFGEDFLYL